MTAIGFRHGHALLVGVGDDLPVTVQDADALNKILTDPARAAYPEKQVEKLIEGAATREGILKAFDRLIKRANTDPDATVVVYFSGHGVFYGPTAEYFLVPNGFDWNRRKETY